MVRERKASGMTMRVRSGCGKCENVRKTKETWQAVTVEFINISKELRERSERTAFLH